MAQVPNRYYNSPWIAQAAANLSDALFGNPERDYQRLQTKALEENMARAGRAEALATQQREQNAVMHQQWGDVIDQWGVPSEAELEELGPVERAAKMIELDKAAGHRRLASSVARAPDSKPSDFLPILGIEGPSYLEKLGLLGTQHAYNMEKTQYVTEAQVAMRNSTNWTELTKSRENIEYLLKKGALDYEQAKQLREIAFNYDTALANLHAQNKKEFELLKRQYPEYNKVSANEDIAELALIQHDAKANNRELSPQQMDRIRGLTAINFQTSGNSTIARQKAWEQFLSENDAKESYWGEITYTPKRIGQGGNLSDSVGAEPQDTLPGGTGDGVFNEPTSYEPAPTPTVPAQNRDPVDAGAIKENQIVELNNGEIWTRRNGVLIRLTDMEKLPREQLDEFFRGR